MMGAPVRRLRTRHRRARALAAGRRQPPPPPRPPATAPPGRSRRGATSSTRTSCRSWNPDRAAPDRAARLVPHRRRHARRRRAAPGCGSAGRAPCPSRRCRSARRSRSAGGRPRAFARRIPRHRPALGRRPRGVGRPPGARARHGGRRRPDGRRRRRTPAASRCSTRGYRREALREIRRIVPTVRNRGIVNLYTGSDEPITIIPRGPRRARRRSGARLARDFRRAHRPHAAGPGRAADHEPARRACAGSRGSRFSGDRFFAMKAEQARLVRRLDPTALVSPNDYGFIDGFIPWDYTRLAGFADVVEARSLRQLPRARPRRPGALQPGLRRQAARPTSAGMRTRVVVQAFDYSRYQPVAGDLWTWSAPGPAGRRHRPELLRLGQPALHQPPPLRRDARRRPRRARRPPARRRRPTPSTSCSTRRRARGRGSPRAPAGVRYRTSGDEIYTTYALLGELGGGAFSFDADTRLVREPARLAAAREHLAAPRRDPRRRRRAAARRVGAGRRHADRHRPRRVHADPVGRLAGGGARPS